MSATKKEAGLFRLGPNSWRIVARIRVAGEIRQKQKTIEGISKEEARARRAEFKRELREAKPASSSLKPAYESFGDLCTFYLDRNGSGGMGSTFKALVRDLGDVDKREIGERFDQYLQILRNEPIPGTADCRKNSTVNRYIGCANIVCRFAIRHEKLDRNPIARFKKMPEEPRDRVLTDAERQRLLTTLQRLNSYLYWPVYFSQWNPIRRGDLFGLTRVNLDRMKPWIHFYPQKTKRRRFRETCLVGIDRALLSYWDSLPADCPYLFPRIDENGKWHKVGDIKRHWHTVLKAAEIDDFVFHDLKHCAITWMIDNGYTERDLKNLGIQYTTAMIDRYYRFSAEKVLVKWKRDQNGENVQTDPFKLAEADSVSI